MHSEPAIRLDKVSKIYRLFGSQREQLIHVLGLDRFGFKSSAPIKEFAALSDVSLDIPKGHRVGVIGRNGAGKTTLLKLICGNFAPSSGEITVLGDVQALMGTGLGFHPDYTGRENALASLQYNGLSRAKYEEILADIVDFCELGDFLDQPFKTYSLGMQARLMFATSTAIQPDILIVDEVLGAGDGYFIAKSRQRMDRLVGNGCTMLLVSHSTQQVLEMCQEAVWLDQGSIRMQGEAFLVVKAYEEYVFGKNALHFPTHRLTDDSKILERADGKPSPGSNVDRLVAGSEIFGKMQEPIFVPHAGTPNLPNALPDDTFEFDFQARGGISRWESEKGLKICGFTILDASGPNNHLASMKPAKIVFFLRAEMTGEFICRYGVAIHDMQGRCITRIFGPADSFCLQEGNVRTVEILLNPLQIGPGEYTIGISVLENTTLEMINSARRYDLLGRSFEFSVVVPDSLASTSSAFYHTAEWYFR